MCFVIRDSQFASFHSRLSTQPNIAQTNCGWFVAKVVKTFGILWATETFDEFRFHENQTVALNSSELKAGQPVIYQPKVGRGSDILFISRECFKTRVNPREPSNLIGRTSRLWLELLIRRWKFGFLVRG
jgi:hypothetical protein